MKFSIGDKVLLRQTGEEGTVVSFLSRDLVEVMVSGTSFPVYADELEHPYLTWFTQQSQQKKSRPSMPEIAAEPLQKRVARLAQGVHFSFFPQFILHSMEDVVRSLKIFLINELPIPVRFSYKVKLQQGTLFAHDGTLASFSNIYLHEIDFEQMNDNPRFEWRLEGVTKEPLKAEEGVTKIRPAKLFELINRLMQANEPSFSIKLVDDFLPMPKEQAKVAIKPAPPRVVHDMSHIAGLNIRQDFTSYQVLDLHIEKLMPDIHGLSNAAIMEIQLGALQRAVQSAIVHGQEQMIVIHGVGSGVLRNAVHQLLAETPQVLRYSNEWLGKYGFGATEVIFKKH